MAYTVPSLAQFRARFPEFASVVDAQVTIAIADASRFVTRKWVEADYQPAILFLAAHYVMQFVLREAEGGSAVGAGEVRSISYGPMTIGLRGASGAASDTSADVANDVYMERFNQLRPSPILPIVLTGSGAV